MTTGFTMAAASLLLQVTDLLQDPSVREQADRPLSYARVCSAADEAALREAMEMFTYRLLSVYTESVLR